MINLRYFIVKSLSNDCRRSSSRASTSSATFCLYCDAQHSTVQHSTVLYSTVQYSTVQYSTVQYSTVKYSTVQYSTVQYSTVQYTVSGLVAGSGLCNLLWNVVPTSQTLLFAASVYILSFCLGFEFLYRPHPPAILLYFCWAHVF